MLIILRKLQRRLALYLAALLLLTLAACGGYGSSQSQLASKPGPTNTSASMSQALAELDVLPMPPTADPVQFKELKLKLREILLSKDQSKLAAAAPISTRSKAGFLSIAGSGGTGTLTWSYRNEGDYNLDSIVGVSDLTPLGIHFGKTGSSSDWSVARVADGNWDGAVSVGDLVSIGANFARRVEGYHLQYSDTLTGGTWATTTDIPFDTGVIAAGGGHRDYLIHATSGMIAGYYRVVPYDATGDGIPSDATTYPATAYYESENNDDGANADVLPAFPFPAPIVDGNLGTGNTFGDLDGDTTDIFACQAQDAGTLDFRLTLDAALGDIDLFLFQQGVTDPIASSQGYGDNEHVSATVTAGTVYYAMARVYSGYGEYRLYGTFTPQGANQPPTAVLNPQPNSGPAPLSVTLNASGSTDTDGTIVKYEFDFGEGGGFQDYGATSSTGHSYNTAGVFTAQVRVTDNGGLSDTDTALVSVTGGGPGTVSGTILTDAGRSLPGVDVTLSDGGTYMTVNTDSLGYYEFTAVPAGSYSITPSLHEDTFDPATRNVNVNGGPAGGQDFTAHFFSTISPYPFLSGTPPSQVVHAGLGTTIDVYIEDGSAVSGWNPSLLDAVIAALPRWNLVGDPWNLFHIQFTPVIDNAEIWIHWVPSLGGNTLGIAYWSGTDGQINLPMEIQLATTVGPNPVDGPTEEKGAIHEVGHTLGLWQHSDSDLDIMYPIATQSWPSLRDMWTVYTLYHTPPNWTTGGRHGSAVGQGFMEFRIE